MDKFDELDDRLDSLRVEYRATQLKMERSREAYGAASNRLDYAGMKLHGGRCKEYEERLVVLLSDIRETAKERLDVTIEAINQMTPDEIERLLKLLPKPGR